MNRRSSGNVLTRINFSQRFLLDYGPKNAPDVCFKHLFQSQMLKTKCFLSPLDNSEPQNAPTVCFKQLFNHECLKPKVFPLLRKILTEIIDPLTKITRDARREKREDMHARCKCQIQISDVNDFIE